MMLERATTSAFGEFTHGLGNAFKLVHDELDVCGKMILLVSGIHFQSERRVVAFQYVTVRLSYASAVLSATPDRFSGLGHVYGRAVVVGVAFTITSGEAEQGEQDGQGSRRHGGTRPGDVLPV